MEIKNKILIVEDESPMAKALKIKLEKEGFAVDIANNGEKGLEMMTEGDYDIVLLDLIMPEKDGFYVLGKAKERKINSKIIISSNLSQEEDIIKVKELGAVDYFVKSNTSISEVVQKIREHLK